MDKNNYYFKPMVMRLADTYKKDIREVASDMIKLEAKISAYQFSKGLSSFGSSYNLLAAGRLSDEYKK